jgi:hypothetical protein
MKRTHLRRQSPKRAAAEAEYVAFILAIKDRDGWRCRHCGNARGPLDLHHVWKPRARHLIDPDGCLMLCRRCHERCEGPFNQGRLIVTPLGRGRFHCEVIYARSKAHARAMGLI